MDVIKGEVTITVEGKSFSVSFQVNVEDEQEMEKGIVNAAIEARNKFLYSIGYGRYGN